MRLRMVIFPFLLLAVLSCRRQSPVPAYSDGSVLVSDRISNQKVNAFAEDADGHIWIGTFRGLNKYSVHACHQYFCTDDTLGLPDNQINALYRCRQGNLWIATVNGAAVRTPDGSFRRIPVPEKNRNLVWIGGTPDGKLLMASMSTLFQYDRETDALRPVICGLEAFGNPPMALGPDGRFWVISGGRTLKAYSTEDFSLESAIPVPHAVYHLCLTDRGEIWMSGLGSLSLFDTGSLSFMALPEAIRRERRLMESDVDILYAADEHSLLLHSIRHGMFCYSRTAGKLLHQSDAGFPFDIPDFEIRTLYRDSRHNLWFGSTDQGYSVSYAYKDRFNGNKQLTSAFARKSVTSLCPDRNGRLWITTLKDGTYTYSLATQELRRIPLEQLVPDRHIGYLRCSRVFPDREGEIWLLFADKYRVLRCRYDGGRLRMIDSLFVLFPLAIAEDDAGCIWIGGASGELLKYDKTTRQTVSVPLQGSPDWTFVTDLVFTEAGSLLAACFNQPLHVVSPLSGAVEDCLLSEEEQARCIRRSVFIPNDLFQDSTGDVWIGTVANGLLRRDHASGETVPVEGAPCIDICAVTEDRQGHIWVSTLNGLGKYDRAAGRFVNYFEADGIGGNQFSDRAACLLPDGTLVFGGTHGLTWFNPLDLPRKRSVPLVFEDLKVHNVLVRPGEGAPMALELSACPDIVLRDDQNGFSISFAALDYSEHQRVRYTYLMEGFDKYWVEAGTLHEAYYANLPPGKYTFRVRISDDSGGIAEAENALSVRILPPWHRTWLARTLFALALALLLGLLWSLRLRILRVRRRADERIREERLAKDRAEEEKAQEQRLNRIQMNYFSNVAHEFRSPLTMIAGPVSQLAASDRISGADRQMVSMIQRSTAWMLSLVNQLLDFNRIGNKKLQLKVAKCDIIGPLKGLVDLFRVNAEAKGIELSAYGLEDAFVMWADLDKVTKIVMNLLSNALKFTPSGGRVALGFDVLPRAEAARLFPLTEADTDGQFAEIILSDTGCGIPEDQIEKIFERFYQADNDRGSPNTQGSGIGLFYARTLTGFHHGHIRAANRDGGGAVFRVILPVSASSYTEDERTEAPASMNLPLPAAPLQDDLAPGRSRRRIAVVDDDIDVANYLKMLLAPYYSVYLHFDAASALKAMREEMPDLVVSDVVMPGKSGYELCEAIKRDLYLSHIPVILVTAKVAVESQVQGLDRGADAYVTKPFNPAYLLALVKSLLENREKLHRQLGAATSTEGLGPEVLSPRDSAFMKELYALMDKELANAEIDINRITELMKISRTKFYYKVKGLTGENPSVFFKRYKLNRAADLLKDGRYNMSEIAYMTGFSTLSHFSTSFKKQFGVPPSEYMG